MVLSSTVSFLFYSVYLNLSFSILQGLPNALLSLPLLRTVVLMPTSLVPLLGNHSPRAADLDWNKSSQGISNFLLLCSVVLWSLPGCSDHVSNHQLSTIMCFGYLVLLILYVSSFLSICKIRVGSVVHRSTMCGSSNEIMSNPFVPKCNVICYSAINPH